MHIREFDYELPAELIAQYPIERRDQSRLMVINRKNKTIEHRQFFEITDYFMPGDVLVLNDTKVIPARLIGRKQSGGKVEV
ncbi:MAG: S-adenosylmethionine:tRNA ribosyltransferase-isomerase, partial [Deltaproteobacteria bacterium]|nr:S-adenosylmethionine:tRNA ribosyltransferase-isomerase [Deltaproteobacteria bacterium]